MKPPVFLISTGRTGTKYFSRFFADYGVEVASYHTTKYTRLVNVLGNMSLYGRMPRFLMTKIWRRLKFKSIASHQLRYIECNPFYNTLIDIISDCFPEAKFVLVVRAPKSCVISHVNWEQQRLKSKIANRLVPYWQPVSYGQHLRGWLNDYHQRVEFYCQAWTRKNTVMWESIQENDHAAMIKFEDVFYSDHGVEVMTYLMEWLDILLRKPIRSEAITARQNISRGSAGARWDRECDRILEKHCGTLMKQLGY
jgi:hypothetical protein